jgi:deazaflavin-dependent oxidoreductase (nitroreductase family)
MDKRRFTTAAAKYIVNPITKHVAGYVPWWALLETTGRKSGLPRTHPVGNGLDGDTFWIVAEHGLGANYVKNITAQPRVRIRVAGKWRTGTARVLPDDDTDARQRFIGKPFNSAVLRLVGTDPLTVRVDLDKDA